MNWGWKITIAIIVYMIGIISVVWYTMTLDVNLVSEDYYKQELAYEEQITRQKNTAALPEKPTFAFSADRKLVILTFPDGLQPEQGTITFYRPSDFTKDRTFKIELDEHNQQGFTISGFVPGLWRIKLLWEKEGKSYYQEFSLVF